MVRHSKEAVLSTINATSDSEDEGLKTPLNRRLFAPNRYVSTTLGHLGLALTAFVASQSVLAMIATTKTPATTKAMNRRTPAQ